MIAVHALIGMVIGTVFAQIAEPGPQASLLKGFITVGIGIGYFTFILAQKKQAEQREQDRVRLDKDDAA